jgi:D-alanine-D-alanine ligase-like ATP-grasp enzyme
MWKRLREQGVDVGQLWGAITDVVLKSLIAVEESIPYRANSFELFGFDVLIDQQLRPWLLEVNASPSMARENALDEQVRPP